MKALTLTQPWASLVAIGAKKVETRGWNTSYRGTLAIHVGKSFPRECRDRCEDEPFRSVLAAAGLTLEHLKAVRGYVVAVCRLVAVEPTWTPQTNIFGGDTIVVSPQERAFGDYSAGRFGFFLEDEEPLDMPIAARGALLLWEWTAPPEVAKLIAGGTT